MNEIPVSIGLRLEGISKRYDKTLVLEPFDLAIEEGEFLTILGPSGSGKTTILRILGGFTEPSSGRLLLDGKDITKTAIFDRPFNTVFQDYALFPHMTVAENVGYGLMVRRLAKPEIRKRVNEVLGFVQLETLADRHPAQLSGGQKQRVALARAIICEPRLILLDEPLAALDAELRAQMRLFLKQLQRRLDTTFVFVTHDQEEAITMADRIIVMRDGHIEQIGSPRQIYRDPATAFVAGFIGENNLVPGMVVDTGTSTVLVETVLGRLWASGHAKRGESVLIAIRPENIRLHSADTGDNGPQNARGTVQDVIFVGPTETVILGNEQWGDVRIKTRAASSGRPVDLRPGDDVRLEWDPDMPVLVPQ